MLASGLLLLTLLGQAQPSTYYWRDAAGQTHITNTPPPPDAEVLQTPPPPAVEPGKAPPPGGIRPGPGPGGSQPLLSPVQQQAWRALDERLAKARIEGDHRTPELVADALIRDCLWGQGLWIMPATPFLTVALLGLLGWWLALGLRASLQAPLVAGSLLLGLLLGHLLLTVLLYRPQALRLRQNLELLEQHLGQGKVLKPEQHQLLQQRYQALRRAADPLQPPWQFPMEVKTLRATLKQVLVEP